MFERFTEAAREVVVVATEEARDIRHGYVGVEHLMLALLRPGSGLAGEVLRDAGLSHGAFLAQVVRSLGTGQIDGNALKSIGIDLEQIREAVEGTFGAGALERGAGGGPGRRLLRRSRFVGGHLPFTDTAKKSIELALREAIARNDRSIGSEHVLLGVLRTDGVVLTRALAALEVTPAELRERLVERLKRSA